MESADNLDEEEPKIYQISQYYNHEELTGVLRDKQNIFKVVSLNCQSNDSTIEAGSFPKGKCCFF